MKQIQHLLQSKDDKYVEMKQSLKIFKQEEENYFKDPAELNKGRENEGQ